MLDPESFELLLRQNRSNWCCRFHIIASDGWLGFAQEEDLIMRNLVPGCLAKFEGSVGLLLYCLLGSKPKNKRHTHALVKVIFEERVQV